MYFLRKFIYLFIILQKYNNNLRPKSLIRVLFFIETILDIRHFYTKINDVLKIKCKELLINAGVFELRNPHRR